MVLVHGRKGQRDSSFQAWLHSIPSKTLTSKVAIILDGSENMSTARSILLKREPKLQIVLLHAHLHDDKLSRDLDRQAFVLLSTEAFYKRSLGIRFDADSGGLRVTAVHPAGPAAGLLSAGDVLVSVDGLPLRGRDDDALRAALSGPVGVARAFQVARGAGLDQVDVVAVSAEELAAAPLQVSLLVLDSDALAGLVPRLQALAVEIVEDPDQPGLLHLTGPADATPRVQTFVEVGQAAGWWERIG